MTEDEKELIRKLSFLRDFYSQHSSKEEKITQSFLNREYNGRGNVLFSNKTEDAMEMGMNGHKISHMVDDMDGRFLVLGMINVASSYTHQVLCSMDETTLKRRIDEEAFSVMREVFPKDMHGYEIGSVQILDEHIDDKIFHINALDYAHNNLRSRYGEAEQLVNNAEKYEIVYENGRMYSEKFHDGSYTVYRSDGSKSYEVWSDGSYHDFSDQAQQLQDVEPQQEQRPAQNTAEPTPVVPQPAVDEMKPEEKGQEADPKTEKENDMKEKANKLFEMLSQKDMSAETKTAVAGIIKENPDILISKEFMEKMAINDMNKCPKDGYQEYVKQSSDQLATSRQVLDNLHAMHKEGVLDTVKSGKTPVQYLLDEGRLPNGETLGTQSAKNIISLRAMQKDENYPDKEGITNLHNESTSLIQGMYANGGYGANPNRRNAKGEKMSDLMERHLGNVKKPMSREDLEVGAYRGTLTAEQADQLKKLQNKKEADVNENMGDVKRPEKRKSKDKFSDGDVVKYMYEEWLLAAASWLFNKVEDRVLGVIDDACAIVVTNAAARRNKEREIKADRLKATHGRVGDFDSMFEAVNNGKSSAYNYKKANFASIFEDLNANLRNPNPKWKHQHDPQFIENLKNNPNAQEFLANAPKKLNAQIKLLETTDKLAMIITRLEMTDEFMRSDNAWNNGKEAKTQDELKADFDARSLAKQKMILKGISTISEDTRLLAEVAYDGLANPTMPKEEFIQQHINQEVNTWLTGLSEKASGLLEKQEQELQNNMFAGRGKGAPDAAVKKGIKELNATVEQAINKGNVYDKEEFTDEGSKKRIKAVCGLYDEAVAQNTSGVFDRYKELNQINQEALDAMRAKNITRKQALEAMKSRLAERDGKTVDARIAAYQQGQRSN